MLAQTLRTRPAAFSGLFLVTGFVLIASGSVPLGIAGALLILLAFFVPFIRMLIPNRDTGDSPNNKATVDAASAPARDLEASRPAAKRGETAQPSRAPSRNDPNAAA